MSSNLNSSFSFSDELMQECWSRDDRMNSLFAEFRNRSVNSQDWDSKYKFWERGISDLLSQRQQCSFSVSELSRAFKRKDRTPLCLQTVVVELLRNGEIVSEAEFTRESAGSWTAWAIDTMVKRPVVWSFSKLKNYVIRDTIDAETRFVHKKTVQQLADLILSTIDQDNENVLLALSQVTKNCIEKSGNKNITERNVELALRWLRLEKKAASGINSQSKSEVYVKISTSRVKEVSEAEEGLFKLKEQERQIVRNIENLEKERNAVLTKAKTSVAEGLKEVAKSCLRKKREIDKSIEKRSAALHNVQILIARIHDAHSDTDILNAYKTGGEILKNFESGGLTEENVTNTMDNVSEVVGELADLQNILSSSIGTFDTDADLEEELEDLLAQSPGKPETKLKGEATSLLPDITNLPDLQNELSALHLEDLSLSSNKATSGPPRQMDRPI